MRQAWTAAVYLPSRTPNTAADRDTKNTSVEVADCCTCVERMRQEGGGLAQPAPGTRPHWACRSSTAAAAAAHAVD